MTNEEIVARIQQGEAGLLDTLLEQNSGFIRMVAFKYLSQAKKNRAFDEEDLLQAASIGMLEAVPAWDEERGAFLTVAKLYMLKSIRQELGIRTTKQRIENVEPPALLSAPVGDEDSDSTLQDLLVDQNAINPQDAAEGTDMQRIVREAVAVLPEKQRAVIEGHYFQDLTLAEIGAQFGQGFTEMHNLEERAFRELRRHKRLRRLWREYESACYTIRSFAAWKHTNTSATEAAAMKRERLREELSGELGALEREQLRENMGDELYFELVRLGVL